MASPDGTVEAHTCPGCGRPIPYYFDYCSARCSLREDRREPTGEED